MNFGLDWALIGAVSGLLFMGGIAYNVLISHMERQGYIEGYVALFVAGGVLFTLLGVALIQWQAAVLCLIAFCCSGLPMLAGSVWRYMNNRARGQHNQRDEVRRE